MIYVAFGFGLWFCIVMALGAAFKWKLATRIAGVIAVPLLATLVGVALL